MAQQAAGTGMTRRTFLRSVAATVGITAATILTHGCGTTPTPIPPTATKPPAPTNTTAPAPMATKPPAPTNTTAPPAPTPTTVLPAAGATGKFNAWSQASWNTVTDNAVRDVFVDWGKQNGIQIEFQVFPGATALLEKESAAVAAGQPPEVSNANGSYWYSQGAIADLTSLVTKYKTASGGMYDLAISALTAPDGKTYAAPYAIDTWMVHWRKDIIEKVTGGGPIKSWDQLLEVGAKIQDPPKTYAWGMALGHEADHLNNFMHMIWAYGGRLCDPDGKPDIVNPANKAGIEMISKLWKAKLIPPEALAATQTSFNNELYQKGRGMMVLNPPSVYGWLMVNDKDLLEKTGLATTPKGSAGSFTEGGCLGFHMHKKAKMADKTQAALEFFMQAANIEKVSKSVEGRFVPIYRDHTKTEFWTKGAFAEMKDAALNGRVKCWPAPTQPWISDVESASFTISDMLQKVLNENTAIEKAQEWAQAELMKTYDKFMKK